MRRPPQAREGAERQQFVGIEALAELSKSVSPLADTSRASREIEPDQRDAEEHGDPLTGVVGAETEQGEDTLEQAVLGAPRAFGAAGGFAVHRSVVGGLVDDLGQRWNLMLDGPIDELAPGVRDESGRVYGEAVLVDGATEDDESVAGPGLP